ncbi:hypothetical protein FDP41_013237 [Naegleria fowleri]|uniref:[phosphatase 2A protein]-leucine-carboxy methyltransferase n=1 Tax=Naegleria fowleri TaxID=5763 RepID=A0A6A5C2H9_NAEFO|nr:uncharacterized protein FDP41_013237 [Naegleria fowleri]KAF0980754.1 hypothetical protein FDP41_013237 [Naegleria fowleri]
MTTPSSPFIGTSSMMDEETHPSLLLQPPPSEKTIPPLQQEEQQPSSPSPLPYKSFSFDHHHSATPRPSRFHFSSFSSPPKLSNMLHAPYHVQYFHHDDQQLFSDPSNTMTMIMDQNSSQVIQTNDEATQCKYILTQLGYIKDDYIQHMLKSTNHTHSSPTNKQSLSPSTPLRNHSPLNNNNQNNDFKNQVLTSPIIIKGYYIRYKLIKKFVEDFIQQNIHHDTIQIINLGCGCDTLYFYIRDYCKSNMCSNDQENKSSNTTTTTLPFIKYLELDFATVIDHKKMILEKLNIHTSQQCIVHNISTPNISISHTNDHSSIHAIPNDHSHANDHSSTVVNQLSSEIHTMQHLTNNSISYILESCDLSDIQSFKNIILQHCNTNAPTLFISEVAMCYMSKRDSSLLLDAIYYDLFKQSTFNVKFIVYEPVIDPNNSYGKQMLNNLTKRNSPFTSISSSFNEQYERFKKYYHTTEKTDKWNDENRSTTTSTTIDHTTSHASPSTDSMTSTTRTTTSSTTTTLNNSKLCIHIDTLFNIHNEMIKLDKTLLDIHKRHPMFDGVEEWQMISQVYAFLYIRNCDEINNNNQQEHNHHSNLDIHQCNMTHLLHKMNWN